MYCGGCDVGTVLVRGVGLFWLKRQATGRLYSSFTCCLGLDRYILTVWHCTISHVAWDPVQGSTRTAGILGLYFWGKEARPWYKSITIIVRFCLQVCTL